MRTVAIIPARGGSKGLPRKNCAPLLGRPLVAYSIEAALGCALVDAVYLSTEDAEIARIGETCGARLVARPADLATDAAQNDAVCRHALETIARGDSMPDRLVLLQPTSPLRTADHLTACLAAFRASDARSVMSVCRAEHHPAKCIVIRQGRAEPFAGPEGIETRRQDLELVYRQNGAIYGIGVADFLATGRFYLPPCLPFVMERAASIDIDDAIDFAVAEGVLRAGAGKPAA